MWLFHMIFLYESYGNIGYFLGPFTQNLCLHSKTRGRAAEWENTKASNVILFFFFSLHRNGTKLGFGTCYENIKKIKNMIQKG